MAEKVELAFIDAAVELIPEGSSVIAAVSGGGDSVALLHLLVRYAPRRKIRVAVAHLDHGLRRGSRTDRRFVESLAHELDLPCVADRRDVPSLKRRGESPEEAARRVRRSFLLEARKTLGADTIATGHTLDDQAETVLMRLVRGAGAAALTGMAPAGPGAFARPLLGVERSALRTWMRRKKISWREDPSNADLRFDRNKVRRLLLPALAETLNPKAARHLVEAAGRLRDDALFLDALAAGLLARISEETGSRTLTLDARALAAAPGPLAARAARLALARSGADRRRITSRHIEALLSLARGPGAKQVHLPSGVRATITRGRITLEA